MGAWRDFKSGEVEEGRGFLGFCGRNAGTGLVGCGCAAQRERGEREGGEWGMSGHGCLCRNSSVWRCSDECMFQWGRKVGGIASGER